MTFVSIYTLVCELAAVKIRCKNPVKLRGFENVFWFSKVELETNLYLQLLYLES